MLLLTLARTFLFLPAWLALASICLGMEFFSRVHTRWINGDGQPDHP